MDGIIESIKTFFNDWAAEENRRFEQRIMVDLSLGINASAGLFDTMTEKGWKIYIEADSPQFLLPEGRAAMMHSGSVYSSSMWWPFTAEKDGHDHNSVQWYRDLCDALGYQRSSIPDFVVRGEPVPAFLM